jgi:hypothetical protein
VHHPREFKLLAALISIFFGTGCSVVEGEESDSVFIDLSSSDRVFLQHAIDQEELKTEYFGRLRHRIVKLDVRAFQSRLRLAWETRKKAPTVELTFFEDTVVHIDVTQMNTNRETGASVIFGKIRNEDSDANMFNVFFYSDGRVIGLFHTGSRNFSIAPIEYPTLNADNKYYIVIED